MDVSSIKEKLYNMGIKKTCGNLLIVALVAAIMVISTGNFFVKDKGNRNSIEETDIQLNKQWIPAGTYEEQLEDKLRCILQQISGVGKVSVMITLKSGREVIPAFNMVESGSKTDERDSGGGIRTIIQSSTDKRLAQNSGSITSEQPLIVKEVMPEVQGVIVVAEGAQSPEIAEGLTEAVQAVLGVAAFRVKVYPM